MFCLLPNCAFLPNLAVPFFSLEIWNCLFFFCISSCWILKAMTNEGIYLTLVWLNQWRVQGVLRVVVPLWAVFFRAVLCLSFYVVDISLLDNERNFFYVARCCSTSAYCCLGTAHRRAACLSTIRSGQECWAQKLAWYVFVVLLNCIVGYKVPLPS